MYTPYLDKLTNATQNCASLSMKHFLMTAIRTFPLNRLAKISAGHPFRGKVPEQLDSDVVVVHMKDTDRHTGINWNSCMRTRPCGRRPAWLKDGQLLFAARGTRYYSVLIKDIPADYQAVAAPHFFVIDVLGDEVLPAFLEWQLNQGPCQQYFEQNAEGSVAKSIRRSVLEEATIAVPPMTKQQSIVRLVHTLRRERQTLEEMVRNNERLLTGIATELLKL